MHFIVIGRDGTDEGAAARRSAAHEAHVKLFVDMYRQGIFLYGAAILDDAGQATGSLIVCDFNSRAEMEERWLKHEPYVTGDVWQKIEISRAQVAKAVQTPISH